MDSGAQLERVGARIADRYRIDELLGRGGMAAVYRVCDERSGESLALKRSWARQSAKLRQHAALLEREFYTLAQLAHPRIIEVYDFGVDDRGPYYTMELLTGSGVDEAECLPWRQVAGLMCDVASSLAILHSRGLIHRDVSTRNVRYTQSGRVKLIDFGAMVSMGVAKDVVGTPPFMAPEIVQMQALDARVDLFSLGAVGYRLLTGRHAYPARKIADLRDAWRSKPVPPKTLISDVPAELSALLLRLISLDRGRRPQCAAEVIEKLRALTQLPAEEGVEVARAYLTTPMLVGREAIGLEIRKRVLSLMRGDGGTLVVRGAAGSGRSRILDTCALEAKLLGVSIVRADALDAGSGDWGVVRALAHQLLEQFPALAREAARLTRDVLGQVIDGLRSDEPAMTTATMMSGPAERGVVIRELRDWLLSVAKNQRLLIVVDDVDRIDEPSSAVLAALAHRAERRPMLLAVALERNDQRTLGGSLQLLSDVGHNFEVEELRSDETEALVRSLFGDVPHIQLCASRIHGMSHGNPRAILELAHHLVDTQRARYEAGSWALPSSLDESDLPTTLAASLGARVASLSATARELACALALADGDSPALGEYPTLIRQFDHASVYRALEELVAARVLIASGDSYTFTQRGFLTALPPTITRERRIEIHRQICAMLARRGGDVLRRAHHLFEADLEGDALELLLNTDLQALYPPVALLKRALDAAERLACPASTLHRLRMLLIINAPLAADYSVVSAVYPAVLKQLEQDTGLARYRELEHLPASERLGQALAQAQRAYDETPVDRRVHGVLEAVRELARLYGTVSALAVNTFDQQLLESLPPLQPLFPLSPTLPVLDQILMTSRYWMRGQTFLARSTHQRVLARLAEPDRAGFDESQHGRARLLIEFGIGLVEAILGIESCEDHALVLERQRETRVNAWRVRALFQLAVGDVMSARKCSRRSELLEAQEGLRERYGRATIGGELVMYARLGDVLGVKGLLERLSFMGDRYPGWRPVAQLGLAYYRQLQSDDAGALIHVEHALSGIVAARHPFFAIAACAHIRSLRALQRVDESVQLGHEYMRECNVGELNGAEVALETAISLGAAGNYDRALECLEPAIAQAEQLGRVGFSRGMFFETRAQLAIGMGDRSAFEDYARRCEQAYERANNPALGARLSHLHEQAQTSGLIGTAAVYVIPRSIAPETPASELESVHSRIAECVDAADSARCALTLLLESTYSATGFLFGLGADGRAQLLAALPDAPNEPDLDRWVEQQTHAFDLHEQSDAGTVSGMVVSQATQSETAADMDAQCYVDAEGRTLEPALLIADLGSRRVVAGVLVVQTSPARRAFPPFKLCSAIAQELIKRRDVSATG